MPTHANFTITFQTTVVGILDTINTQISYEATWASRYNTNTMIMLSYHRLVSNTGELLNMTGMTVVAKSLVTEKTVTCTMHAYIK